MLLEENTIVVTDPEVSDIHCKIKNINGGYHLFDIISDRGTFLNGKKILRPKPLHDWDEITIGNTTFLFRGKIGRQDGQG